MNDSRRIFLRAYLIVVGLIGLGGWGLDTLMDRHHRSTSMNSEAVQLSGAFLYIVQSLKEDQNQIQESSSAIFSEQLGYPVALLHLADFTTLAEQYDALEAGEIVQLYDAADLPIYYKRITDTGFVVGLGPMVNADQLTISWPIPLFYLLVAAGVYLWIRPLSRDLQNLQAAARAFGEQGFSTRVLIPQNSWLAPLGHSFNSMAERIQWLLSSHRELTHAVSHELRTPLARLRFSLEMLDTPSHPENNRQLENIYRDMAELNDLIEEMLSYAELDQDNLSAKLEPVTIQAWFTEYYATAQSLNDTSNLSLSLHITDTTIMNIDTRLLKRALDNLVGNARRYGRQKIELSVSEEAGSVRIFVSDDGPGIPADKRETVLSAFTRLPVRRGEVSHGFGLGLAIVKRIVDLHGGEVSIGDSSEGGARIGLILPLETRHSGEIR